MASQRRRKPPFAGQPPCRCLRRLMLPRRPMLAGRRFGHTAEMNSTRFALGYLGTWPQRVGRLSQQWANRIGRATVKASCDFDAQVKHLCGETYGHGRCRQRIPADEQNAHQAALARLRGWRGHHRTKSCKFGDMWSPLGILYVGPCDAPAVSKAAEPSGFVALPLYVEFSPLFCTVALRSTWPLTADDIIDFPMNLGAITSHIHVVRLYRCQHP